LGALWSGRRVAALTIRQRSGAPLDPGRLTEAAPSSDLQDRRQAGPLAPALLMHSARTLGSSILAARPKSSLARESGPPMTSVHVIAEAGTNHNGSVATACRLVDIARLAGADSVKFQLLDPASLYVPRLFKDGRFEAWDVFERRQRSALSDDDYRRIEAYARQAGIPFSCSVFGVAGCTLLRSLDAPYVKIASTDLNYQRLVQEAAETGLRVILSTGMSSLSEVEATVKAFEETGSRRLVLMHCVSVYPCPPERANLSFITELGQFGYPVGYSDHTESSGCSMMAVALGATWIEKHFTYDRSAEGFDHAYAMEPEQMAAFVRDIRLAEQACSTRDPKVGEAEKQVMARARRGLYAAREMKPGETLAERDVLVVRPPNAFTPNDVGSLIGRVVSRPIQRHQPLDPSVFG
jgi:sialic acid synthase SpsE